MRTSLILVSLLAACGGKSTKPATPSGGDAPADKTVTLDYADDTIDAKTASTEPPVALPTPPPAPEPGAPAVTNLPSKSVIRGVIHTAAPKFLACSDKEVSLVLTFAIAPAGNVTSATATGGTDAANTCASEVVKTLAFGSVGSLTKVTYPIKIVK